MDSMFAADSAVSGRGSHAVMDSNNGASCFVELKLVGGENILVVTESCDHHQKVQGVKQLLLYNHIAKSPAELVVRVTRFEDTCPNIVLLAREISLARVRII